jgi:uncharacterized protein with PIN domain
MLDLSSLGAGVWFAIGGITASFFLLWLLNRGKDHDCIFEYPQEEINKNLMTFLETPKGYPKEQLVCPECSTPLVIREGIVRVPSSPTYPYRTTKSWVCPKHNWGWEKIEMS